MAGKAKENKTGVDRFTSNGLGVKVAPMTPEQKAKIDQLKREMAAEDKAKKKK